MLAHRALALALAACTEDPITVVDAGTSAPDAATPDADLPPSDASGRADAEIDAGSCPALGCPSDAGASDATNDDAAASDGSTHDAGVLGPGVRTVAFASNRAGEYDIYLTDLAGTQVRALTGGDGDDFYPVFTPDGARVVFSGTRGMEVHLLEVDLVTGVTTRLPTPGLSRASTPAVSPDDCCIAFEGVRTGEFNPDVYLMRRGQAPVQLTNNMAQDGAPAFSPDGTSLLFASNREGGFHLYSMNIDGSSVVRETRNAGVLGRPTVSRDGLRLVFTRFDQPRRISTLIELTRATDAERVLAQDNDYEPQLSVAGDFLAFATARFGGSDVMLLNLSGMAAATRLTSHMSVDGQPAVSP